MQYKNFQELYAVIRGKTVEVKPKERKKPSFLKPKEEVKEEPKEEEKPKPKKSSRKKKVEE